MKKKILFLTDPQDNRKGIRKKLLKKVPLKLKLQRRPRCGYAIRKNTESGLSQCGSENLLGILHYYTGSCRI
jgi:hypothetical protein